jgi:AcrR family transcriptional regulator
MVKYTAGEKKRQLIIDACKTLFYEKGYNKTTYDDICDFADIPPGSITYHFGSKAEIAALIHAEYEAQNKIYIEKVCGNKYDKTTLMAIEIYHMWQKIFEDEHLRGFLTDMSSENIPHQSAMDVLAGYYRCVMDERGIKIDEPEFSFMVSAQTGVSDELIRLTAQNLESYEFTQPAAFTIRFFSRQIGISSKEISKLETLGLKALRSLPIDLRYYKNFKYDDKHVQRV